MASQTVDRCRLWRAGRVSRFVPTSLASRHDSRAERAPDNTLFDARIPVLILTEISWIRAQRIP